MGTRERPGDSLENIARQLAALAESLARGRMEAGGRLLEIGPPSSFKIKEKVSRGTLSFSLSFEAPVTTAADSPPQQTRPDRLPAASPLSRRERPPAAKGMKKELGRLWKEVGASLAASRAPGEKPAERLLRLCEEYALYSEKEWSEEWRRCAGAVTGALALAARGEAEQARLAALEVDRLIRACHKRYKP